MRHDGTSDVIQIDAAVRVVGFNFAFDAVDIDVASVYRMQIEICLHRNLDIEVRAAVENGTADGHHIVLFFNAQPGCVLIDAPQSARFCRSGIPSIRASLGLDDDIWTAMRFYSDGPIKEIDLQQARP